MEIFCQTHTHTQYRRRQKEETSKDDDSVRDREIKIQSISNIFNIHFFRFFVWSYDIKILSEVTKS